MTEEQSTLLKLAEEAGFSHYGLCSVKTLKTVPEVRDMCAVNKCRAYNSNWTCPPACGSIEDCEKRMKQYGFGILVQTTGVLEDSMDYEAMMDIEAKQSEGCRRMMQLVRQNFRDCLCLFHGPCNICKSCSYPDEPCRFPDKAVSAMEGYGLLVSQVCKDNGVDYYYGKGTLTYTGLFLVKSKAEEPAEG
ncbi:MAG: DUF2284 domain-containing protein [Eubacterium sp.]|nr:DUF2284 domain-containing protein [Eubacterium sp.]